MMDKDFEILRELKKEFLQVNELLKLLEEVRNETITEISEEVE